MFGVSVICTPQWKAGEENVPSFIGRLFYDNMNKENQLPMKPESIFQNVTHPLGENKKCQTGNNWLN